MAKAVHAHATRSHHTCGSKVKVGDILCLKMTVITVKGRGAEDAIKCVKIFNGAETCTVAFVPRYMLSVNQFMARFENGQMRIVRVLELYRNTTWSLVQRSLKKAINPGTMECKRLGRPL